MWSVMRRVRVTLKYRYITVTLPLHHCYITVTSPLHYRYITVTLLLHCRCPAVYHPMRCSLYHTAQVIAAVRGLAVTVGRMHTQLSDIGARMVTLETNSNKQSTSVAELITGVNTLSMVRAPEPQTMQREAARPGAPQAPPPPPPPVTPHAQPPLVAPLVTPTPLVAPLVMPRDAFAVLVGGRGRRRPDDDDDDDRAGGDDVLPRLHGSRGQHAGPSLADAERR